MREPFANGGTGYGRLWVTDRVPASPLSALADLVTGPKCLLKRLTDIAVARQWIREFATAMSMPDMLEEFDKLVARRD
jgi:hypothetical protein